MWALSGLSSRIFLQSFNLLRLIKLNMIKRPFTPFSGQFERDAFSCYAAFVCVRNKKSFKEDDKPILHSFLKRTRDSRCFESRDDK